jgi:RHS repeat-associated protein
MLTDASSSYGWNAESEMQSAAGVNYIYDGEGNRLQKSSGKIYWYGAGAEILDESDSNGNFTSEYVFFGGKRVAMRSISTGAIYYYAEDMLGSSRSIVQDGQTSPCFDADFYPFGGEHDIAITCSQNYKFEGKERDTETNNDDFGARYYSSRLGRWLSADWSSVPVPVPYANLTNPQTLNLYAMVSDNPETFADLDGHCWKFVGAACWIGDRIADLGQSIRNTVTGYGWHTNDTLRARADKAREDMEGKGIFDTSTGKVKIYTQDELKKMSYRDVLKAEKYYDSLGHVSDEDLLKINQALAAAAVNALGMSSDWGKNRLVKELQDRGYVLDKPTKSGDGLIYKNAQTGEEVRIMPKPSREPYSGEPAAKFENEWYLRYRTGPDQAWGPHITIPDK